MWLKNAACSLGIIKLRESSFVRQKKKPNWLMTWGWKGGLKVEFKPGLPQHCTLKNSNFMEISTKEKNPDCLEKKRNFLLQVWKRLSPLTLKTCQHRIFRRSSCSFCGQSIEWVKPLTKLMCQVGASKHRNYCTS